MKVQNVQSDTAAVIPKLTCSLLRMKQQKKLCWIVRFGGCVFVSLTLPTYPLFHFLSHVFIVVPELKTVSLDYVEQEFSCWVSQLSLGCVKFLFSTEDLKQPSVFTEFCIWEMRWVGRGKKKDVTFWSLPHILALGVVRAWLRDVSSREPQLQAPCPGSDLCSDKLEHIVLSKDVILLLTVILELVSLVEACVMWHRVYPEGLWERATHSIMFLLSHSKKSVTWPVLSFGSFDNAL